ncbi:MAG: serine hydrolase [Syntrophobacteraceae bacterium]
MEISRRILRHLIPAWGCLLALALVFHPGQARADWLQDLEADAVNWMTDAGIPGMAIAIVENDTVIYAKGFGHLSKDHSSPKVDVNTVFDIGSCSKAFAATQLAILADRKQLAWTDPVRKYLPSFGMYDPWVNREFQVEDLLCHRSGLPWYSLFSMLLVGYSPDSQVASIRYKQPSTSFRSAFAYQNNMYITASKLIEAKTGQTWGKNLQDTIFTPLGMTRSVTTAAEKNKMKNVAVGHLLMPNGSLWPSPPNWSNNFVDDNVLAAGAVKSTATDMAQWIRLNLSLGKFGTRQIVSEENMRYLQTPRMLMAPWANGPASPYWGPVSYGAGWQYFGLAPQPLITHDGTETNFKCSILLVPGANIGIVILGNIGANFTSDASLGARPGVVQKIAFRFYDLYFGRYTSEAELDEHVSRVQALQAGPAGAPAAVTSEAPDLPLKSYCGVYYNPAYGGFTVRPSNGKLVITMGPLKMRARMVPVGGNTFWAYLPDYPDNFPMYLPLTFAFPSSGPATMTIGTVLGWPQNDVFTRISD